MKARMLSRYLRVAPVLALLLIGWQSAGYAIPHIAGGFTWHPIGDDALIWVSPKVLRHQDGTLTANEVLDAGASVDSVQGIVYGPSGATALFWTPARVFLHSQGTLTATPVLFQASDISHVRGIIYRPLSHDALIWTPTMVLKYDLGAGIVTEVQQGGASIPDVQGIIYNPTAVEALLWKPGEVLRYDSGSGTTSEILEGGASVPSVQNIVYQPFGTEALMWTPGQVLKYVPGTGTASEVLDGGGSIADVRGIVWNPDGTEALTWTPSKVLNYAGGVVNEVQEMGEPIPDVNGILYHPFGWEALIWNPDRVFTTAGGLNAQQILESGMPIANTNGIVYVYSWESLALIWTETKVLRYLEFGLNAEEVFEQPGGPSIANVQGIVYHPFVTTAHIWLPDRVLRYLHPTLTAQEVLEQPGDLSIANTQAIVYHPFGEEALILTPSKYLMHPDPQTTFDAQEVKKDGTDPIVTYDTNEVEEVQILVLWHPPDSTDRPTPPDSGQGPRGDPSTGIVGSPVLTPSWFCGSPSGAVHVPFGGTPWPKSTVVGAGHYRSPFVVGPTPIPSFVDGLSAVLFATLDTTGVSEKVGSRPVGRCELLGSVPNPFSHNTVITYSVQGSRGAEGQGSDISTYELINLSVYDVAGRLVETLVNRRQGAGVYQVQWEAKGQPSGVYFYRLQTGDLSATRKMVILK